VFSLEGIAAIPRSEIDFKIVVTRFGKHTFADVNLQRQQLVVFLKRGEKLHVTDQTIVLLVDNKSH